jgi:hypothetical protein
VEDLLAGEIRRLIVETNDFAAAAERAAEAHVRQTLQLWLQGQQRLAAARLARDGREVLALEAVRSAEHWRQQRESQLNVDLAELVHRLEGHFNRQLIEVRALVSTLFDVALAPPGERMTLGDSPSFYFDVSPPAGQTELIANVVRCHLPGRWGERAVTRSLLAETSEVVDKQFGRARADFQARLEGAGRQLAREAQQRYHDSVASLTTALTRAQELHQASERARREQTAVLAGRIFALRELGERLRTVRDSTDAGKA